MGVWSQFGKNGGDGGDKARPGWGLCHWGFKTNGPGNPGKRFAVPGPQPQRMNHFVRQCVCHLHRIRFDHGHDQFMGLIRAVCRGKGLPHCFFRSKRKAAGNAIGRHGFALF